MLTAQIPKELEGKVNTIIQYINHTSKKLIHMTLSKLLAHPSCC